MGNGDLGVSGQSARVEAIKPEGFMDEKKYPVSPQSEKAYKDIAVQLDQWIEQLNHKTNEVKLNSSLLPSPLLVCSVITRSLFHKQKSSLENQEKDSAGEGKGKRFKSLSIMVPDNMSRSIVTKTADFPMGLASNGDGLHETQGQSAARRQSMSDAGINANNACAAE
jgi:hypothetical protein